MLDDDEVIEVLRAGLETVILMFELDRTSTEDRKKALDTFLSWRQDLKLEDKELRRRLINDPDFTSRHFDTLGMKMSERPTPFVGYEAGRAEAAGGEATYRKMQGLAQREGIAIDDKSFGYLRDKAWKQCPELAPRLETARSLHEAMMAAERSSSRYLEASELTRLVSESRPDLLLSEYSHRTDDSPAAMQAFAEEQERELDVLEKFTCEAVAWGEGSGVVTDPRDYRQRDDARSRYAAAFPSRVPEALKPVFQFRRRGAA